VEIKEELDALPEIKQPEIEQEKPASEIKRGGPLLRMRPLDRGIPPQWK
jgi:hypothetical protein